MFFEKVSLIYMINFKVVIVMIMVIIIVILGFIIWIEFIFIRNMIVYVIFVMIF